MEFDTLSHAGLRVRAGGRELLCDPWVTGSCYWRSWWNYPPVPKTLVETLKPDFIYLTHLHWDHFHAPSMRLFDPGVPVLIPYDRHDRMLRDLAAMGRRNVIELRHGERRELAPGLAVTSYHIAPLATDSALAIEAEGRVLLNANDAKFAGAPLRQILRRHPRVDFAFRSHSSSNPRINFHYLGSDEIQYDDIESYLHSFALFMERVKPAFAIPLGSNSCLLHDDSYRYNPLLQTPEAVERYFTAYARRHGLATGIRIMVPGDRYSDSGGFEIAESDWFTRRDAHLAVYRERVRPTLDRQAAHEAEVRVPIEAVRAFFERIARDAPFFLFGPARGREVLLVSHSAAGTDGFAVRIDTGQVRAVPAEAFERFDARIELPAHILDQSVRRNMFGHAVVCKRVEFHATREAMPALERFTFLAAALEDEIFPLSALFTRRALRSLRPRWREALLYARALVAHFRGLSMVEMEHEFLAPRAAPRPRIDWAEWAPAGAPRRQAA